MFTGSKEQQAISKLAAQYGRRDTSKDGRVGFVRVGLQTDRKTGYIHTVAPKGTGADPDALLTETRFVNDITDEYMVFSVAIMDYVQASITNKLLSKNSVEELRLDFFVGVRVADNGELEYIRLLKSGSAYRKSNEFEKEFAPAQKAINSLIARVKANNFGAVDARKSVEEDGTLTMYGMYLLHHNKSDARLKAWKLGQTVAAAKLNEMPSVAEQQDAKAEAEILAASVERVGSRNGKHK